MGSLFGYSSSLAPNDYRSLYEEAQSSSRATSAVTARSAFEAPKLAASTVGTSSTSTAASSSSIGSAVGSAIGSTSAVSNSLTSASFPSQSMSNSIDWPDLSTSASAIGSKRTGKTSGSSSGSIGGGVVNSSVATWNGSMGNGGVGNGATKAPGIVSTANGTAASKGEIPIILCSETVIYTPHTLDHQHFACTMLYIVCGFTLYIVPWYIQSRLVVL